MTAVDPTTNARPRRDMLCALAVALVAPGALVAACGDSGSDSDSGAGGSGGSGSGKSGGGAAPTTLSTIPDGGGLIVDNPSGGKALLVRKGKDVTAFSASCTHQGTTIAAPKNGVATCPSHGSQFDAQTGKAVHGPATKPLRKLTVTVDGDKVTIS